MSIYAVESAITEWNTLTDTTVKALAGPVKRFFIDIITRDIDLVASILDLVDNSVDSAHELRPDGDFSGLKIEVVANDKEFSIVDNCAGIDVHDAKTYVFRLGRPSDIEGSEGSIGQFGVGMKRALFKLGWAFVVDSVSATGHFTVDLDVRKWEKTPDWEIELTVHDRDRKASTGTTIIVNELHASIKAALGRDDVLGRLREDLKSKHRLAIENGLQLVLNGKPLNPIPSQLAYGENIKPLMKSFDVHTAIGTIVGVEIFVGVIAESVANEDAAPENSKEAAREAGWHVFGNSRLLLASDRSNTTGWGGSGNMPMYHNQYGRFRGYVFMYSKDSNSLPWNTMKTGVDSSDPTWTKIRGEMITAGKQVVTLLNHLKNERTGENKEADVPISRALEAAQSFTITQLKAIEPSSPLTYPEPNPELEKGDRFKKIAFSVDAEAFLEVSEMVGEKTAAKVGRATFDHFYRTQIAEG